MSTSNGVISKPVSIADVQQTIGNSSGDLTTLCGSSTINKWSFHKPIFTTTPIFEMTDADIYAANDGFTIPSYPNPASLAKDVLDGTLKWNYSAPAENTIFPKRLADFNGYNHAALKYAFTLNTTTWGHTYVTFTPNFSMDTLRNWKWLNQYMATGCKFGLLFYLGLREPTTNTVNLDKIYFYQLGTVNSSQYFDGITLPYDTDIKNIQKSLSGGYSVSPVFTNSTAYTDKTVTALSTSSTDLTDFLWYGFEDARYRVNIASSSLDPDNYLTAKVTCEGSGGGTDKTYLFKSLVLTIKNESLTIGCTLKYHYLFTNVTSSQIPDSTSETTTSIPANSSISLTLCNVSSLVESDWKRVVATAMASLILEFDSTVTFSNGDSYAFNRNIVLKDSTGTFS